MEFSSDQIKNSLNKGLVEFYVGLGCLATGIFTAVVGMFGFGGERLNWTSIGALIMATVYIVRSLAADEVSRKAQEK